MKRIIALLLAISMCFSIVMPSMAAAWEDQSAEASASVVQEDGHGSAADSSGEEHQSGSSDKTRADDSDKARSDDSDREAGQDVSSVSPQENAETSSSGSNQKSAQASSSGSDQKSAEASSSGSDQKSAEASSSGSDQKSAEASSSGSDQKSAPAPTQDGSEPERSNTPAREAGSEEQPQSPEQGDQSARTEQPAESSVTAAPEQASLKTLRKSLKTVEGVTYTFTLSYDESAGIPDNAQLSVVELNLALTEEEQKLKENKERPYDTERFLSEKALEQETFDLRQGLKVRDQKDYVLFSKFLDLSLTAGGKSIQPQAPVLVTLETDAVETGASDALEAAVYDKKATKAWQKKLKKQQKEQEARKKAGKVLLVETRQPEKVYTRLKVTNETKKKKDARVSFRLEQFGRLGVAGVVKTLKSWKVNNETMCVYGPRHLKAKVTKEKLKSPKAGLEKVRAFSVKPNEKKNPAYDVTFWVGGLPGQYTAAEGELTTMDADDPDSGVVACELKSSGKTGHTLIGTEGTDAPVAIPAGKTVGVLWDTGLREQSVQTEQVSVKGLLPKKAQLTANDMLWRYSRPEEVVKGVSAEARTLAAYDITISGRKGEFQPDDGESVSVSIQNEDIHENRNLELWHLRDDGSVDIIRDFEVTGNTISFDASGFSVYMVVQVTKEQVITAGDGKSYKVTVTYDSDAGIPDDAELSVSELDAKGKDYQKYVKKAAKKLETEEKNFAFAHAFDIALVNPETGEHCQPAKPLKVSVELLDKVSGSSVDVVHFGKKTQVLESSVSGKSVEFETDGFSVYVLTGVTTYTITFMAIDEAVGTYATYGDVQTVKAGEKPFVPQLPSSDTREFCGWYLEDETQQGATSVALEEKPYDFSKEIEENLVLYAKYASYAYVIFHDQYDSESNTWPVAHTRRVELTDQGGGDQAAQVQIDNLSAPYTGSAKVAFCGWSTTAVTTPGVYLNADDNNRPYAISWTDTPETNANYGKITVRSKTNLYPIYKPTHWLTYYSAQSGLGADYIPPKELFDGDGLATLPVPQRDNYVFQGWYTGTLATTTVAGKSVETVHYSHQVTDANGGLMNGSNPYLTEPDGGVSFSQANSKLVLSADATLYAKWSANYHVVIRRQSPTDPIDDDDTNNHYEYYETLTKTAEIGKTVSFDGSGTSYAGYTFVSSDGPKTIGNTEEITTLNAYYKLTAAQTPSGSYKLSFADSVAETGVAMPQAYDGSDAEHPEIPYGTSLSSLSIQTPDNRKSENGYDIYQFSGWYLDPGCKMKANLTTMTMPNHDLTLYAGWEAVWFVVTMDPNYGALYYYDGGVLKGSGATWFWQSYDSELIGEYTHVTRNYVPSSAGNYYYANRNRAYYGLGNTGEWSPNEPSDRQTFYTTNPSESTEDSTFEYAPGSYSYIGWYELCDDGTEKPFDFSKKPDHAVTLRLHWKRTGQFYLGFNAGDGGTLNIGTSETPVLPEAYSDNASVTLSRTASKTNYAFVGWKVRGDTTEKLYTPGDILTLQADYAVRESGKDIVWLDAVYNKLEKVTIVYHANGGQMSESPDPGSIPGSQTGDPSTPISSANLSANAAKGTLSVSGLENNSKYTLSNGKKADNSVFAFTKDSAQLVGWSNSAAYDPANAETQLFALGATVGVNLNGGSVTDLYAVWQVPVTYHLDGENKPDSAAWSAPWSDSGSPYTDSGGDYSKNVYLKTPVSEPGAAYIPTCDSEHMFYYWATRSGEGTTASPYVYTQYDFSAPVTDALDLYAVWVGPVQVPAYAVDASAETMIERVAQSIKVGTEPVTLADKASPPTDYKYAFAVALSSTAARNNVYEADAITQIYYNQAEKHLYVKYADTSRADAILNEGTEIRFIYYQKKQRKIVYKSMDATGVMSDVTPDAEEAPVNTGATLLGQYDMANSVTTPLAWVSGHSYYAFAVGDVNAANASQLYRMTATSDIDANRPTLHLRNTWQGFQYTTDSGADPTWTDCGFDPQLYVVYFDQKPTVVTIREETVGTGAVRDTEFQYRLVVEKTTGGATTAVYDSDAVEDGNGGTTQHVYKLKNGESQSAVLFYDNAGGTESTQTITVTQKDTKVSGAFTTVVGDTETKTWTSAPSSNAGGTQTVTFTNRHKSLPVEVHVALLEGGRAVLKDNDRASDNSNYCFNLTLGDSAAFLTKLPSTTVFTGDTTQYALGAIAYGTDNGSTVTVEGMGLSSISYGQVSGNHYELLLDDSTDKPLGANEIYYLYYPIPKIQYVKETDIGFVPVTGANNAATPAPDKITYNYQELTMNSYPVVQEQRLTIPVNGQRVISQSGHCFRMPPNLDDGVYAAYLTYQSIGAGDAGKTGSDQIATAHGRTLYLRVSERAVQYSFTGAEGSWQDFTDTPTIYAVYEERGYDLMLNKTVDMSASGNDPLFSNASFRVEITSPAITKSSYAVEGFESAAISATPANGDTPGKIELTVKDGTSVRIKSLGQGTYTVTEYDNQNYVLTAKRESIVSGGTPTNIDSISTLPDGSGKRFSLALNAETKLDLVNTPQQLCQIQYGGTTHIFYTFDDALKYVENYISTLTATIELLSDYLIPAEDVVVIPYSWNITLKTAESRTGGPATITRSDALMDQPLFTNNGTLTLSDIVLDGNNIPVTAPLIQSDGDLTIGSSTLLQNANRTGNGGAIFAESGNITVKGQIKDNQASGKGAAIYHSGNGTGTGTISMDSGAVLSGNVADGDGGAIYAHSGKIELKGTAALTNNSTTSGSGGAICVENASITIKQAAALTGNTAALSGGAICANTATITISELSSETRPNISNNKAPKMGGAIYINKGTIAVSGGSISGNGAVSASPLTLTEKGGAIYAGSAAVSISETASIASNQAQYGGAVYAESGNVTVELTAGSLSNNTASGSGGAIYAEGGNVTLSGGSMSGNKATGTGDTDGGGLVHARTGSVTVTGVAVTKNEASKHGGAVYAQNGAVTFTNCTTVTGNKATANGGVICADGGTVTISESSFGGTGTNNGNSAANGGAIYAGTGNVSLSGGSMSGNKATGTGDTDGGGLVHAGTGSVTVTGVTLTGNEASKHGGAVYAQNGAVTFTNCTAVTGNKATANGGVFCADSGTVTISGSSFGGTGTNDGNSAANGGAVYAGSGNVSITNSSTMKGNSATANGGAICTDTGSVSATGASFGGTETGAANSAAKGGAIYSNKGAVSLSGSSVVKNSATTDGGGIYAGEGSVSLSNTQMTGNKAKGGNGGAFYAGSGAVDISGTGALTENEAANGGAFYMGSGIANLAAVTVTNNTTTNGSAIFVHEGTINFNAGSVQSNASTNGGGVGIGSITARLYCKGSVLIKNNKQGTDDANIYLNQDSNDIININNINADAYIGVYVPDNMLDKRGVPGATFASYANVNDGNIKDDTVKNDRHEFNIQKDTDARKLYWGKEIPLQLRYLDSYNGAFPPTNAGVGVHKSGKIYPTTHNAAFSELAASIYKGLTATELGRMTTTANYGGTFLVNSFPKKDGDAVTMGDYVTGIRWDITGQKWMVTKWDGTESDLGSKKIIIYYTEPAYLSIENNTEMPLNISDITVGEMSLLSSGTTAGYGMVFAKNGAIRSALLPVTTDDLSLGVNASITLLLPSGHNMAYTLDGTFTTTAGATVPLRKGSPDAQAESLTVRSDGTFDQITGTTLSDSGTYQVIFGSDKEICKVVDKNGTEYTFPKISEALDFIKDPSASTRFPDNSATFDANGTTGKKATIQMLTDYLLPASDPVVVPRKYDITLTTAEVEPETPVDGIHYYHPSAGKISAGETRATLSRDSENTESMIDGFVGAPANGKAKDGTILRISDLMFDGKSVRGGSNGGVVSTKYCDVYVDNVDFNNVYAQNGGALFVVYNVDLTNTNPAKATVANTTLEVRNSTFTNCYSKPSQKAGESSTDYNNRIKRMGGGAIIAGTANLVLDSCTFENCQADDQAGAVFHRVDGNYNSNTTINNCTFTNCRAKAAGGLELDSKYITVTNTSFSTCVATDRNGGGFNVYALNSATPTAECKVTLKGCSFTNCQAKNFGGGFRSTATYTKVMDCSFTSCSARNGDGSGGAIGISSANAIKAEIYACQLTGCEATKLGGGIYYVGSELIVGDTYNHTYTGTDNQEHTVTGTGTMSITNCTATNEGGGIYSGKDGGTLKMTNVDVKNNTSKNQSGGGVYTKASTVTITGGSVSNNTAKNQGGGIYQSKDGTFAMTGTTVNGNTTTDNTGGGVHTVAKTVTITGGSISNNTAKKDGGGLYSNAQTSLTINGTTISGNSSQNNSGGGLWYDGVDDTKRANMTLTLSGCAINGNSANYGGGVYTQVKTVTIGDYTYIDANNQSQTAHTSISNNTAKNHGGGLYHNVYLKQSDNTYAYLDGAALSVTNASIDGNRITASGKYGGGVYTNVKTLTITGGSISNNTATSDGGGLWYDGSDNDKRGAMTLTLSGCAIDGNTALNGNGGGIYTQVKTVTIDTGGNTGMSVSHNTAAKGGGLWHNVCFKQSDDTYTFINGAALSVTDATVNGNRATSGNGGGILSNAATASLVGVTMNDNRAPNGSGGGLSYYELNAKGYIQSLTVEGCTISGNNASGNGGGIYTLARTVTIRDRGATQTTISNCTAGDSGGGLCHNRNDNEDTVSTVLTNCTIEGCSADGTGTDNGGGALYSNTGELTMTGVTLRNNTASNKGGGVLYDYYRAGFYTNKPDTGGLTVDSCTLTGNTASMGGAVYTRSYMRLRNGSSITDNQLSNSIAENAAGVYLPDNITLVVGQKEDDPEHPKNTDTVIVRDNYTSAGVPSNLRLWSNTNNENNAQSIYVYCNLSSDSVVRVVNAYKIGTIFGESAIENPIGFTQGFTNDFSVFKADDDSLKGIIDRAQANYQSIIWGGPAICKITDGQGHLLYLRVNTDGKGADAAIFDRLDTGDVNDDSISSAFSLLRMEKDFPSESFTGPELYKANGELYTGPDYCVKMLDNFTTTSSVIINAHTDRHITLTTADRTDADYPFEHFKPVKEKTNTTRATVLCGTGVGESFITTKANLTIDNIILNGGSLKGHTGTRLVEVDQPNITVELQGDAILCNATTTGNGGGILVKQGDVEIGISGTGGSNGSIRNCHAQNGGGIAMEGAGTLTFKRGNLFQCGATANGGGVYQNAGDQDAENGFIMTNGSIEGCTADNGGGVFVANGKSFYFHGTSGTIRGNQATSEGGGIAVDGLNTRLYFSEKPIVSGNSCSGHTSNVELNTGMVNEDDTNAVIQVKYPGLQNKAYIGVYVAGTDNTPPSSPYDYHGKEAKPFATYENGCNTKTFYSFVNDRNGLKGGLIAGTNTQYVYWVKIFSLEVSLSIDSTVEIPENEEFEFTVVLEGTATVTGQANAKDIYGEYGDMSFTSDGSRKTTATVRLKPGENESWAEGVKCKAENLSAGLYYTVTIKPTEAQKKKYVIIPTSYTGIIGENNDSNVNVAESERYISRAPFKAIRAVCKLTYDNGNMLYYEDTDLRGTKRRVPAAFKSLPDAVDALNGTLYTGATLSDPMYSKHDDLSMEMLVLDYTLPSAVELPSGIPVTLTTASISAAAFPLDNASRPEATISTVQRGNSYDTASMMTAKGALTLTGITLDGADHATSAYGGIVHVNSGGSLSIGSVATLQKSKTTGNGGAVYIADGGSLHITDGTITGNQALNGGAVYIAGGGTGAMSGGMIEKNRAVKPDGSSTTIKAKGAGIYLATRSKLELSGTPGFGVGVNNSASITETRANYADSLIAEQNGGTTYNFEHQDIYLEENGTDPASLVLKGNLTGDPGSIWIWADKDNQNRCAMASPFAVVDFTEAVTDETYKIFRNAQTDKVTFVSDGNYLTGDHEREKDRFIHWTGGFDVLFNKVDSFGEPLPGATFTLYTDPACTEVYQRGGTDVFAESADGTALYQTTSLQTLGKGVVLFEKLPANVYYMKETVSPTGYSNKLPDSSGTPVENRYVILVGSAKIKEWDQTYITIHANTQSVQYADENHFKNFGVKSGSYAIFLLDQANEPEVAPNIARYGVMNTSTIERRVILDKINKNTREPLPNAEFDLLSADHSVTQTRLNSGKSINGTQTGGAFYVGTLPLGKYYLHETRVPAGYQNSKTWWTLELKKDGTITLTGPEPTEPDTP